MPKETQDFFRYLPVGPRDEEWELFVTAAGFQAIPPGSPYPLLGHSQSHDFTWRRGRILQEYAVVYVPRGEGQFESKEAGEVGVCAGDVLLLFPGVWHRYRPAPEVGWNAHWVTFQGEYAHRLQQRGFLRAEEPVLHTDIDERMTHAFTHLMDHVRGEPLGLQQIAAADTLQILATVLSAVRHQRTTDQIHDAVRRAKAGIEASAGGLPAVAEIAEEVGLSRSYFHKVFKECTGLSPYQYHLQIQVSRAQGLLRESALSVKQVAKAVKFQSEYQFCRTFKKKTGMTPGQYRRGGPDARRPVRPPRDRRKTREPRP